MALAHNDLAALYSSDSAYRRWFKAWWAADYSLSGLNKKHAGNGHVVTGEFGGREWPRGWMPPHDQSGKANPSFYWLDENSAQSYWWQYVRGSLAGAFIRGGGPRYLQPSQSLRYCFFGEDVHIDPPNENVVLSDIFALGSVELNISRQLEIDFRGAQVRKNVQIISSRAVSYDLSGAMVGGDVNIEGSTASGLIGKAKISGSLTAQGGLVGTALKVRDISLVQPSNKGDADVELPGIRAQNVRISGSYKAISLQDSTLTALDLSLREGAAVSSSNIKAKSVVVRGTAATIDLAGVTADHLRFRDLNADKIEFPGASSRTLHCNAVLCASLNFSHSRVTEETLFDRCQFRESLRSSSSAFEGPASFARCAMPGVVDFSNAKFCRGASFKVGSGSEVAAEASFKHIGEANFSGATFEPGTDEVCANFDGRQTLEAANFEAANFSGIPMFYECAFHENISFRGATFDIERPSQSYLQAVLSLKWAEFGAELVRAYSYPASIDGAHVAEAWAELRRPLGIRRAHENERLSKYERAYNALRQRFEEVGNAKYERQFHNYELRARRRRIDSDAPVIEGLISFLYDALSQYGQSISRPLWMLFFTWLLFAGGYFLAAGIADQNAALESLVFSARQMIKPFSAWGREFGLSATLMLSGESHAPGDWIVNLLGIGSPNEIIRSSVVRLVATFQSLLSIVLLFLSGLAIRRTFGVG